MAADISIHHVSVSYSAPGWGTLPALGPLSFEITSGEFVGLVGPSGCGKSTLVRVLAGLQIPTAGEVWLDNVRLTEPSSRIGMMFQNANLMPWRTVLDNIGLPLELAGIPKETRYNAAHNLLKMLDLNDFARAYPGELSGGMAQRVALGRLLAQQPDAMLLDEPFGALDALTREKISLDLLSVWSQHMLTALMVTHDLREAVFLSDRVLVMSRRPGRIIADIPVLLPRPRQLDDVFSDGFTQTAREVRAAIDRA